MELQQLPLAAEGIRNEIKEMIPETASLSNQPIQSQAVLLQEDNNGNKTYGGELLEERISRLKEKMGLDKVRAVIDFLGHLTDHV